MTHRTNELNAILSAAHFAAERHANQKRKGKAGEPYVNHLLEVAQLISSALPEPDTNLVIAALLHDVIEDAGVTKDELVERFGSDVADLVSEVTDDKALPKAERKRLQVENGTEEVCPGASDQASGQDLQHPCDAVKPACRLGLGPKARIRCVGQAGGGRSECAQPGAQSGI